jgi:methionyl-tRNA formyltransferase
LRIALFTMESAGSAEAVLRFAERHADRLVLVGHSPPLAAHRATWRALSSGGPGLLPYLAVNHLLPPAGSALRRPRRLADLCAERGIPTLRLAAEEQMRAALLEARADLLVSFHLDRILGPAVLAAPIRGGINVHPSLLPRHRGPVPAFHGLAEGATGVSVHALVPRIDAGGIWAQQAVALPAGTSALAAARALHIAALPLLDDVLDRIAAGETDPDPPEILAYRGWPAAAERRRAGVRLVTCGDFRTAWQAPAGGWRA